MMERVYIFSNGTEAMGWKDYNCDRCYIGYRGEKWNCKLEKEIDRCEFTDSKISKKTYDIVMPDCDRFLEGDDYEAKQIMMRKQAKANRKRLEKKGQGRLI